MRRVGDSWNRLQLGPGPTIYPQVVAIDCVGIRAANRRDAKSRLSCIVMAVDFECRARDDLPANQRRSGPPARAALTG